MVGMMMGMAMVNRKRRSADDYGQPYMTPGPNTPNSYAGNETPMQMDGGYGRGHMGPLGFKGWYFSFSFSFLSSRRHLTPSSSLP